MLAARIDLQKEHQLGNARLVAQGYESHVFAVPSPNPARGDDPGHGHMLAGEPNQPTGRIAPPE